MKKRLEPNAPRFHTLWESRENRRIFIMKKEEWESVKSSEGTPVLLDLEEIRTLPFGGISNHPGYLGAVATNTGEEVSIAIYREDPVDDPYPINVDRYTIWESFPSQILEDRTEMIQTADTNANGNFLEYEEKHVFIVKDDAGDDHWLKNLPSSVVALIDTID